MKYLNDAAIKADYKMCGTLNRILPYKQQHHKNDQKQNFRQLSYYFSSNVNMAKTLKKDKYI